MNELQIFQNAQLGAVRFTTYQDKPYAVGVDVAKMLEYAYPSQAIGDHCKGVVKLPIPSAGGVQETNCIPEGDIYRLIVKAADQSKSQQVKKKADRIEKWIFDEVLPTLRKTGAYIVNTCPRQPERTGELASYIKVVGKYMEKQGSPAFEIMQMIAQVSAQHGIILPQNIVKPNPYQLALWN